MRDEYVIAVVLILGVMLFILEPSFVLTHL